MNGLLSRTPKFLSPLISSTVKMPTCSWPTLPNKCVKQVGVVGGVTEDAAMSGVAVCRSLTCTGLGVEDVVQDRDHQVKQLLTL